MTAKNLKSEYSEIELGEKMSKTTATMFVETNLKEIKEKYCSDMYEILHELSITIHDERLDKPLNKSDDTQQSLFLRLLDALLNR